MQQKLNEENDWTELDLHKSNLNHQHDGLKQPSTDLTKYSSKKNIKYSPR